MKGLFKTSLLLFCCILFPALLAYPALTCLKQFNFDDERPLAKWAQMILHGKVDYTVMKSGANGYVDAFSDKSCSALYYRIGYKLKDYPMLSWRWRVNKFPDKKKAMTEKEKNDYAARIYVIFPFLSFSSSKFIEYVWDKEMPVGTITTSPDGENIKMIVARSGISSGGEWKSERRDVYEDYIKAFGRPPSLGVGAVAMMCDAYNTKSSAESMFDDIAIEAK